MKDDAMSGVIGCWLHNTNMFTDNCAGPTDDDAAIFITGTQNIVLFIFFNEEIKILIIFFRSACIFAGHL